MRYQPSREAITKKVRRHSGRYYPKPTNNDPEAQLYIQEEYDDWDNYRDGMRDWDGDNKKIIKRPNLYLCNTDKVRHMNKKNKRLLKRKKEMKNRNLYK